MKREPDNLVLHDEAASAGGGVVRAVNRLWAWGLLVGIGSIWGVTFSLAKIATEGGAHPLGITLWHGVLGVAMLSAYVLGRRRRMPLDRRHLEFYFVCGMLGTAIPGTLFFYAAKHVAAGVLSITVGMVPLLTFVFALAFRLERYTIAKMLGLMSGMAAILMIAVPDSSLPDRSAVIWVLAGVLAASCYAVENAYIAMRRPDGSDAFTLLLGMMTTAMLVLAPIVFVTGSSFAFAWPWTVVEWAIVAMAFVNVLAYGTFVYLVTYAGPVFAGQTAYVVTLAGVAWGILLFAETHSLWVWGALGAMILGLALVTPREEEAGR